VYRIVQLHDGSVEAKSQVGKGTALIVRLPVR
jgi:signal transduction histidine kinase